MTSAPYALGGFRAREAQLRYYLRVLRVIAAVEFKMKYADSAMGYLWSFAKPLAYFGVLWVVFGRLFAVGPRPQDFALYLIVGLVIYLFFVDAIAMALVSIATRGSLLRRLAFSPLVLPISVIATACVTFLVNLLAVGVFVVLAHATPSLDWLLLVPLLIELYLFVLGLGLVLATLFVRFRDVLQVWDLTAQLLIFMTPIMYPVTILPDWAQKAVFLNPLVQVMQDIRAIVVGSDVTLVTDVYGAFGRLLPLTVTLVALGGGLLIFRRDAPRFAERV